MNVETPLDAPEGLNVCIVIVLHWVFVVFCKSPGFLLFGQLMLLISLINNQHLRTSSSTQSLADCLHLQSGHKAPLWLSYVPVNSPA